MKPASNSGRFIFSSTTLVVIVAEAAEDNALPDQVKGGR